MRRQIRRRFGLIILLGALLPPVLAGGCSGRYATSEVSEQEEAEIESALEDYVTSASGAARQDSGGVPKWVAGVEKVELKEAVKMEEGYKALARLGGEGPDKTRYFLLSRTDEGLKVTGLLSP